MTHLVDKIVVLGRNGPEPTVREIIYRYYAQHIGDPLVAIVIAREYLKALDDEILVNNTDPPSPSNFDAYFEAYLQRIRNGISS